MPNPNRIDPEYDSGWIALERADALPKAYLITSDNFAGGNPGETVTEDELEGCNIPALIEAGHITAQTQPEAIEATNKEQ